MIQGMLREKEDFEANIIPFNQELASANISLILNPKNTIEVKSKGEIILEEYGL